VDEEAIAALGWSAKKKKNDNNKPTWASVGVTATKYL
jgi:hypothetical protein